MDGHQKYTKRYKLEDIIYNEYYNPLQFPRLSLVSSSLAGRLGPGRSSVVLCYKQDGHQFWTVHFILKQNATASMGVEF